MGYIVTMEHITTPSKKFDEFVQNDDLMEYTDTMENFIIPHIIETFLKTNDFMYLKGEVLLMKGSGMSDQDIIDNFYHISLELFDEDTSLDMENVVKYILNPTE